MLFYVSDTAAPSLEVSDVARALSGRGLLVLAPVSARGWFGGRLVVAWDPSDVRTGLGLAEAGRALQNTFDSQDASLNVVVAEYDGWCTEIRYDRPVSAEELRAVLGAGSVDGPGPTVPVGEGAQYSPRWCTSTFHETGAPLIDDARAGVSAMEYRASVREVQERIRDGDVYVLNLTYRVEGRAHVRPPDAFVSLHGRAGADFSALLEKDDGEALVSISPERFLRVRHEDGALIAEICPIKGTRPRGASPTSDAALARELRQDAKERAEHVMVVDLERNDLGRVCVPGTVQVDPLYEVVPTPYCHQLVSTVRGELSPDVGFGEVLEATFPCGSVTGAPKIAAMTIISELERSPRGAYCGALFAAMAGELDSSVLIRTMEYESADEKAGEATGGTVADATGRLVRWGTGCGITVESSPASEWLESVLKASPVAGDGVPSVALLETCRVSRSRVPLLDRHLARLASAGCGPSLLAVVLERLRNVVAPQPGVPQDGRLRILVSPSGEVAVHADTRPSSLSVEGGPTIVLFRVDTPPALPPHAAKPAERSYWDAAHAFACAHRGHQAVLVLPDGSLVDGSTASVWLRFGRSLVTPCSPPAVDGIARGLVFDVAKGLGFIAEESRLTTDDLECAEEVFLTNALAGVVTVRGREGPASGALQEAFLRALRST